MKGRIVGVLVLLVWGIVKLPIETGMTRARNADRFHGFAQTASLREQAGQAGVIAVFGGLRSTVADLLWIRAHIAWQSVEWGRMKYLFDVVTALQPQRVNFWDMAAWHMAWNASVAAERDETVPEFQRLKNKEDYHKLGEDFLLRGISANPDSWELYDRLGGLYRDKFRDHYKAHLAYKEAALRPDRLEYVDRFAVYELADSPGHEKEAYEQLLALYNRGKQEWLPTLLKKLQLMEIKLGVPPEQRVYIPPESRHSADK